MATKPDVDKQFRELTTDELMLATICECPFPDLGRARAWHDGYRAGVIALGEYLKSTAV